MPSSRVRRFLFRTYYPTDCFLCPGKSVAPFLDAVGSAFSKVIFYGAKAAGEGSISVERSFQKAEGACWG